MKWLLWKEYRHNRLIVFTALFLLLAPHLFALCVTCLAQFIGDRDALTWREGFIASSIWSLMMCQFAIALIGGNAIAGERVDRSAEFLFSLPITRRRILAGKILLALAITAVIYLFNASVRFACGLRGPDFAFVGGFVGITGLTFFCVAWFLSALIANPTFATCAGVAVPFLLAASLSLSQLRGWWHFSSVADVGFWYVVTCLILAPVCFAVGTWRYLARVEP